MIGCVTLRHTLFYWKNFFHNNKNSTFCNWFWLDICFMALLRIFLLVYSFYRTFVRLYIKNSTLFSVKAAIKHI
jgi:hypothetical protein